MRASQYAYAYILLILFAIPNLSYSQEEEPEKKSFWTRLAENRDKKIAEGKPLFTPFIAPAFTPELGFLISAGGLYSFEFKKVAKGTPRSSIPFAAGVSSNGSLIFNARPTIYGRRSRGIGEIWFKSQPDNYWGVGYRNAREREQSEEQTAYDREWARFYYKYLRSIGRFFYAGVAVDVNWTRATNLNPLMEVDPFVLRFGTETSNLGFGGSIQYDSRDFIVNAYRGLFLDLNFTTYGNVLLTDNEYQLIDIDYRQYQTLGRERRTLAWQMRYRQTIGDAPWPELSQMGTPFDLRGYFWGRFRDEMMFFTIVEYRHMLGEAPTKGSFNFKDRSGFVTWLAIGTIAPSIEKITDWLPNGGIGYRFEVEPRMNLRFDLGIGVDSALFYISFNEAF